MGFAKAAAASSGGSSTATIMGYAMTLGACVYKAPVIRNILKAGSTHGLSPIAVYLETSGLLAFIAYNYYRENPFSSYSDVIITVMQELVIVACILLMGGTVVADADANTEKKPEEVKENEKKETKEKESNKEKEVVNKEKINNKESTTTEEKPKPCPQSITHILGLLIAASIYFFLIHLGVTTSALTQSYVISYAIAVKVIAKVPQIIKNFTERKIGVQSLWTAGTACLGPIVKFYIAIVQVKDPLLVGGAVITLVLNLIVFVQIVLFRTPKSSVSNVEKKDKTD